MIDAACEENFDAWLQELDEQLIQGDEFRYEPGEFNVIAAHWRPLFDEGLTPREAFQRALDAHRAEPRP